MAAATLEPPAAPPGVQIVEAGPPKPPPAPTSTIRVSEMGSPAEPVAPKRGSRWDSLREGLQKKADAKAARDYPESATPTPPVSTPPKSPSKGTDSAELAADPGTNPEAGSTITDPASAPTEPAAAPATEGEPPKGKEKANPWKLYKAEKEARAEVEKNFQELRKQIVPEQERKALEERITKAEARAKELDEEIRFVKYEKSTEFQEKFHKPYVAAWNRAMKELSEITVTDPQTQQARPVTAEDMMELVQLPLGKAREVADAVFGKFSADVMAHRKEISVLLQQRNEALDEAKKTGADREAQQSAQIQNLFKELDTTIKKEWEHVIQTDLANPENGKFFKPREGVQEWNDRLEKGAKLVDEAFAMNPRDPRLTPAQRTEIIRKHAAVRNRAIGWGPLKWENAQLLAKVEALEKKLAGYVQSAPPAGGGAPASTEQTPMSGMGRIRAALEKIAK